MNGRSLLIAATVTVLATVIGGLWLTGSPSTQRDRRFDRDRLSDLKQIERQIRTYHETHSVLPASLDALAADPNARFEGQDPESGRPYTYTPSSVSTYRLCATFRLPFERRGRSPYNHDAPFWHHPAGDHCFEVDMNVDPNR